MDGAHGGHEAVGPREGIFSECGVHAVGARQKRGNHQLTVRRTGFG